MVVPYNYLAPRVKKPPLGGFYDEVLNAFIVLYIFGYIYRFFIKQSIKNKYCNRGRDESTIVPNQTQTEQSCCLSKRQRRKKRQLYRRCKSYSDSEYRIFTTKVNSKTERSLPTISFLSERIHFVVDNCANMHVCCVRSLIGALVPSGASLKTAKAMEMKKKCYMVQFEFHGKMIME